MRKGFTIILVVILIAAIFVFGLGYVAYSAGGNIKAVKIEDISAMIQVKSLGDYFENNYVGQTLLYASWEKSFKLAREGGGFDIWKEDELGEITQEKVEENLIGKIRSSSYFQNFKGPQCEVNFREPYSISFLEVHDTGFEFSGEKNTIEFVCSREFIDTKYYLNVSRNINSTGNRFFHLFNAGKAFSENLNENFDELPDPTGIYVGLGIGPTKEFSENMAKGFAKFFAESDFRQKIQFALLKSIEKTKNKLPEETEIKIENFQSLISINVLKQVEGFLPEVLQDLINVKRDLKENLETLKSTIREIIETSRTATDEVKEKINSVANTEKIRNTIDSVKEKIDQLFNLAEISDEVSKFKNDLKNYVDSVEIPESKLKDKLQESLNKKSLEMEKELTDEISGSLKKDEIVQTSSLKGNIVKGASFDSFEDHETTEINWTEIQRVINETDFSILIDSFKDSVKNITKQEIEIFLRENVEKKILEYLNQNNLSVKISNAINLTELKQKVKEIISDNLKKPIEDEIVSFISSQVNETINKTIEEIKKEIHKAIDEAFSNKDFSLIDQNVKDVVLKELSDEAVKTILKDLGDEIAKIVEEELRERINTEIEENKEKFFKNIDETVEEKLKNIEDISEKIDMQINTSIENTIRKIISLAVNLTGEFTDRRIDEMFRPFEEEFENELIRAEELKFLVLFAINISLEAKLEGGSFNVDEVSLSSLEEEKSESEKVAEAISDGIHKAVEENIKEPIKEMYADLLIFPEKIKEDLKKEIDVKLNNIEILDEFNKAKNEVKENVDGTFEDVNSILDEVDNVLDKVNDLVEMQNKLEEMLEKIEEKIDQVIEILKIGETGKSFDFEFVDEKIIATVPIPVPVPPICPGECFSSIVSVKLDPKTINVETNIKDLKYVLPVSEGYKNLEFKFNYEHEFEGTLNNQLGKKSEIPIDSGGPEESPTS